MDNIMMMWYNIKEYIFRGRTLLVEIILFLLIFTVAFVFSGIATYRYCRKKAVKRAGSGEKTEDGDDNGC